MKKESEKNMFQLSKFLTDVTVNGLGGIFRAKDNSCKFLWIISNVLCLSVALVLCYRQINQYLLYGVTTRMKVARHPAKPDFPAITFCTTSFARTSFVNEKLQNKEMFALMFSKWAPDNVEKVKHFLQASCQNTSAYRPDLEHESEDLYKSLAIATLTAKDVVIGCWFAGVQTPCANDEKYFAQALTDLGSCFAFNEQRQKQIMDGTGPFKLAGIGPSKGFKFLLNVHQEEYCTPFNAYDGIGFLFGLKENHAPYDFHCYNGFQKIPVGYDVSINIKPTRFIRNTEHLNRCTSRPLLDSSGKNPIPYFRGVCLIVGLVKLFYESCHCVIPSYDFYAPYMNAHNFDIDGFPENLTFENSCSNFYKYYTCITTVLAKLWMNQLWHTIPFCPLPCLENVYTMSFGMRKISWNSLKSLNSSSVEEAYHMATVKLNISIEAWVERNLVLANFYYGDESIDIFIDNQSFDISDLIIYVANVLGLFFGMSFISFFEILYGVFQYWFSFLFRQLR